MKYPHHTNRIKVSTRPDAVSILDAANMSARPGYYSGRGARRGDLSGVQLCAMYESVTTHHGADAGLHFTKMVAGLKVVSATDFILALYALEGRDWAEPIIADRSVQGIHVDAPCDTEKGQTQAMIGMMESAFGSRGNDSLQIKNEFLQWLKKLADAQPEIVSKDVLEAAREMAFSGGRDIRGYWF